MQEQLKDCDDPIAKRAKARAPIRWLIVVVFAVAMAWVESAVVYYLRTLINRIEPYQEIPLPVVGGLGMAEFIREAATLVMLFSVGVLAGNSPRSRLGFAAIAFGVWDIFYYVFLKVMCGWPHSLFDWDILFLLPLPWWGPVLAPVCIAGLMVAWGTFASLCERPVESLPRTAGIWCVSFLGATLALYVFMVDSLRVAHGGVPALRTLLPQPFNWPLFIVGLLLMAVPVIENVFWIARQKFLSNACAVLNVKSRGLTEAN